MCFLFFISIFIVLENIYIYKKILLKHSLVSCSFSFIPKKIINRNSAEDSRSFNDVNDKIARM